MKKITLLITLLFALARTVMGQTVQPATPAADSTARTVTGIIIDEQHQPIELANVTLLATDSTFIQGTCSTADGRFTLTLPADNKRYLLQVSSIGYRTACRPCPIDGGDTGEWLLQTDNILLQEATVTARRPQYKLKQGRLETEVRHTLLSTLNNANDVLQHSPGVRSSDEGYTVFGKGTPVIYIDNRRLQDTDELTQLSAADILRVELITNPGAEYEADVHAVIRIRTVKGRRDGLGGTIDLGGSQGRRFAYNGRIGLNYQQGGFALQASAHGMHVNERREQTATYDIATATDRILLNNEADFNNHDHQLLGGGKVNLSYDFNPHHSIGASYQYTRIPDFRLDSKSQYSTRRGNTVQDYTDYTSSAIQQSTNHQLNAYYQGDAGQLHIDFTADYAQSTGRFRQDAQEICTEVETDTETYRDINSDNRSRSRLYAAKLILSYPVWKGTLKVGGDYTFIRRNDRSVNRQGILPDTDSRIDESKGAAFSEYAATIGKVSATAGLRYEHARSRYYEAGVYMPEQSRTYDDWYPNVSIDFPVGKVQGSLSYTIKTNRPSFSNLRSSLNYNNRYVYEGGNPLLQPETVHHLQLSALWKWVQVNLAYRNRRHAIIFQTREWEENPDIVIFSSDNYPRMQQLNASLFLSPTVGWWQPQAGVFFTQPFFTLTNMGEQVRMNQANFYFVLQNTFTLPRKWILSLDADYQTEGDMGAMHQLPYWGIDVGIRRQFLDKRLTVRLQATDIFHTRNQSFTLRGSRMTYRKDNRPDSRSVSLTLSYRFNAAARQYKGRHASEADMQRM